MINKISKGQIKVEERKAQIQTNKKKQEQERQLRKQKDLLKEEVLGTYKKTVIDNFLSVFSHNYGNAYDYDSLINSLSFNIKEDKNGLAPSFLFDESKVKFDSEIRQEYKNFNPNAIKDFVGLHTFIDPNLIGVQYFSDAEEYWIYEDFSKDISELQNIQGQFIPTTLGERFGTFNRINKLVGYTPRKESGNIAKQQIDNTWDKIKSKVIKKANITNKAQ